MECLTLIHGRSTERIFRYTIDSSLLLLVVKVEDGDDEEDDEDDISNICKQVKAT